MIKTQLLTLNEKELGVQRGEAPLAGVQRAAPFGGVWGKAPRTKHTKESYGK